MKEGMNELEWQKVARLDVHDRHCLTILREAVRNLLEESCGYPCEGDIIEFKLELNCVEDVTGGVWMRIRDGGKGGHK